MSDKPQKKKKPRRIRCSHCGELFVRKDIFYGPDPFASDIYDDDTPVWECKECRDESAADI